MRHIVGILLLMKCFRQTYPSDLRPLTNASGVLVRLWTEVKTANRATQFINAIHDAVAQRNEAEQGRVWNTITVFMAVSGLLSRIAGGDGIHSSVMKSRAVKSVFCRVDHHTSFSSLVSCLYIYGFLYIWHTKYSSPTEFWPERGGTVCSRTPVTQGWWEWRQTWNEVDNIQMSPRICCTRSSLWTKGQVHISLSLS